VAVADLAKPFNTQDLRGDIIFDETFGLCPRIKPPGIGRRYPSLPHWLAQQHQRREQWGEELRLLYVALTRARDTLILTAAVSESKWKSLWAGSGPMTLRSIVAAKSYADWLGLWFAQNAGGSKPAGTEGRLPHLRWRLADETELADEPAEAPAQKELPPLDDQTQRKLLEKLAWNYPFAAATGRAAKSSVTALRRLAPEELDGEAEQVFRLPIPPKRSTPPAAKSKLSAADIGRAHHVFLQFVALEKTSDAAALESESKRLEREKVLSADERTALNLEDIAAFWRSAAGRSISRQAANVRRELAFTVRFDPAELEALTGAKSAPGLADEFVVVQGVADLVVLLPKEIWLVDFKTDKIGPDGLTDKLKTYAPQLKLYARALEKIYSRPVTACWLHFLASRRTEEI
jgi:ATP-dependent helicase/nuclease subunit A